MSFEYLIGRIVLIVGGSLLTLFILGLLTYFVYNQWLVRILDWKNELSRKEFFELVRQHRKNLKGDK